MRERTLAIVPTFNRSALISETLVSLLGQTRLPDRLMVVDDGSTESLVDVLAQFPGVVYLRQDNAGKASALNRALACTHEPWVWIFDDDDIAAPTALDQLQSALAARGDCGFAYGGYDNFRVDACGRAEVSSAALPSFEPEALLPALLERCFVFQGAMLVRRSAFQAVGPFDERLVRSQDYEMLLRLARTTQGARVDDILLHQRLHTGRRGTASTAVSHLQMERAAYAYDQQIFRSLVPKLEASDFLARGTPLSPSALLDAAVQRLCVYGRKGLWADAAEALDEIADRAHALGRRRLTPVQADTLARTFDIYSRGLIELSASRFSRRLNRVRPLSLRVSLRTALIRPLFYWLRAALLRRSRDQLRDSLKAIWLLGRPASLALAAAHRLRSKIERQPAAKPPRPSPPASEAASTPSSERS